MVAMPKTSRRIVPVATALRPGRDVEGHPVAFLFTDLHSSTALYERVGDAAAYEIVRRHFAFLAGIVLENNGVVVKTIGDAVMAVFGDPVDAVKAALAMQVRIAEFEQTNGDSDRRLTIKLGVHSGGSVRVEIDDRPDYFGSAVNLAARLRGQSQDGDVVLSQVIADHPRVRRLLAALPTREESLPFKGFDGVVRFVRVMPPGEHSIGDSPPLSMPMRSSARPPRACLALGGR